MTLIEAVAGTAVLGVVLVSLVVTSSRMASQRRRAEDTITACRIADELLDKWWAKRSDMDRSGGGEVPGREGWTWRTRTRQTRQADALAGEVVVLEIHPPEAQGLSKPEAAAATVEILLPKKLDALLRELDDD